MLETQVTRAHRGPPASDVRPWGPGRPEGTQVAAGDRRIPLTQNLSFLFTDIQGSTAMLRRLGDAYAAALAEHHRLIRAALAAHGGREVDTQGDGFFAVFTSPTACVASAADMQRAIASAVWAPGEPLRVRIGVHSGEAADTVVGLVGLDVHRAARVSGVAHGGQVVLSATTAALVRESMPAGTALRSLGFHRLKDLGSPTELFQMDVDGLEMSFPPLRSLDNPDLRHNLPSRLSLFVGRGAELEEVRSLVGTSRLVTLTGAGGCGKTRLALHVAADLLDGSGDGVWFVDLAPLTAGEQVAGAVATTLGLSGTSGGAGPGALLDALRNQQVLLVLDNCEHLVDACADLAERLLIRCPGVHVLATSREPLNVDGEHVYRVPSLATPLDDAAPDDVRHSEAVQLFADRALHHGATVDWGDGSSTQLVGRVCRRLDGIPLAIELAAARLGTLSLPELDTRLDHRFALLNRGLRTALPRQQTLLAMVEWSWDLLVPEERSLLTGLSVFAGGFDVPAVEGVAPAVAGPADALLEHLGALVDKSLVQFEPQRRTAPRYRLLETVRDFAADRLEDGGADTAGRVRAAHRHYYLTLAEAASSRLVSHGQAEWLERLDLEVDNFRTAIDLCRRENEPSEGIRLAAALRMFWKARGRAVEGADALRALLAMPSADVTGALRGRGLAALAYLSEQTGDYAAARGYTDDGLAIARAARDDALTADLLDIRAFTLLRQGQASHALPIVGEGLELARRCGDTHLVARLLAARAFALDSSGDHAAAVRDATDSVDLYRRVGDQRQVGTMVGNLGYSELSTGAFTSARAHLVESLEIARLLDDRYGVVYETFNLGLAELLAGDVEQARRLFATSLDQARRVGLTASVGYALLGLAITAPSGEDARSARLHGSADAVLASLGETAEPLEAGLREDHRRGLAAAMGPEAFDREYAAGRALNLDGALTLGIYGNPAGPTTPGPGSVTAPS